MPLTLPRFPGFFTAVPTRPQVFPNELLLEILSRVTCEGTLHSLLRTSPTLRADAERRLYSGSYLNYDSWSEKKHKRFLGLIASTLRLAELVLVYSIRYFPTTDANFRETLCDAFSKMRNLEELTYQSIEPSLVLLTRPYHFQLKSFTLLSALEDPEYVASFLHTQRKLKRIVLHSEVTRRLYRNVQTDLMSSGLGSNSSLTSSSLSTRPYANPNILHICDLLRTHYNVSDWKGKSITKDTFFHLPVDHAGIIFPTDPGVTKTLSKARQACVGKRPEGRWRLYPHEPILKSFVHRLENVTNLELIDRPEEDIEEATFLSSLTTLAITCPNIPFLTMLHTPRTRYIQNFFQKFEFLEEVYMHCPCSADYQRPSEQWVYERWTKDGKKETRTRGEWGSIFITQWDPEAMVISRHTPLTYEFSMTTKLDSKDTKKNSEQ